MSTVGGQQGNDTAAATRIAIETLEAAHAEARANTRRAWDELDDNDIARHWSAVAGWLRHRIRKIEAGEEPDWPDAFMHVVSTGMEQTDEVPRDLGTPEMRQRLDEFQAVRDRGAGEAHTSAVIPSAVSS